jgi:NitT/TauT family transport system substrate-binding protein
MGIRCRRARRRGATIAAGGVAAVALLGGNAASAPALQTSSGAEAMTITVNTLPIANRLPLDLGIKKGFFAKQGIEIKLNVLQSGNDIVLALANNSGEIGYVGWVPAMIARTRGIPVTAVAASEVEGTTEADNWQNVLVKGSSSIRTPADLRDKTIAVNALKGVSEVVIRGALKKLGLDPGAVKLLAMPFPAMRAALASGQVDAIHVPEPFLSQGLNIDGARIILAPGPVLGRFWPNGLYIAMRDWTIRNPGLARRFRTAINESLSYAQAHPEEIRPLLPATAQNIRLPVWSPVIDRDKLLQLARYAKEFDVITTLPNFTQLVPSSVLSGLTLEAAVGPGRFISLRLDGRRVTTLNAGRYTIVVNDRTASHNFHLTGPGIDRRTGLRTRGRSTWTLTLGRGTFRFASDARAGSLTGSFKVVSR